MGLQPRKYEMPARGYAVLVRLRRPGHPYLTAYPGLVISQIQYWAKSPCGGWIVSINDFRHKRCAVAVEVEPGVWEPWAVLATDVARVGCARLTQPTWKLALAHGLPFIRAAIYSRRNVHVAELYTRCRPLSPTRRERQPPARNPLARRHDLPDSVW